jgi:5'-nucleotidase
VERPLVIVTNDDGFESDGLWAAVEAVLPLGEVIVAAPDRQWSGAGRSMPPFVSGRLSCEEIEFLGERVTACAIDASPALAVIHGVIELASRPPSLVVSGVNFGANLGTEVTVSGTVGAALEGGAFGIPAIAVSMEMDPAYHLTGPDDIDWQVAKTVTRQFAGHLLAASLPFDVHALNINIPADATIDTPWWLTHLSRRRYYLPTAPDRKEGQGRPGYKVIADFVQAEVDSDVWAVLVERVISVTPISLDLTSRVDFRDLDTCLRGDESDCLEAEKVPASLTEIVPIPVQAR